MRKLLNPLITINLPVFATAAVDAMNPLLGDQLVSIDEDQIAGV